MSGGRSQQNRIIDHQNEQIRKQYEMDLKNYEFSYGQRVRRDDEGNPIKDEGGDIKSLTRCLMMMVQNLVY